MPHARAIHGNQGDAFLDRDGFHLRGAVVDVGRYDGAFESRRLGGVHMQRNLVLPDGQDAARMQDLCAVAGDFLGLVVVQGAQQPGGRHGAGIGAEHARYIGPNLETRRLQLGRKIGRGGVRSAPPQQHGVPGLIRRNETLGDHHLIERPPLRLQALIGCEIAGRRQHARLQSGARARIGTQHPARVRPGGGDSLRIQVRRPQGGCEQLTHRHDSCARSVADLGLSRHRVRHLPKLCDEAFEQRARHDAEAFGKRAVLRVDAVERLAVGSRRGRGQQ